MKRAKNLSPWTAALLAAGVLSQPALLRGEEKANLLQTALSATTISGYVDTSVIWKFGTGNGGAGVGNPQPGDTFPGRSYDGTGKQDGFNLNVVALTLRKPLDESEWSAGYNFTLLLGPDAVNYNSSPGVGPTDLALKDAYVELKVPVGNGVNFRLGNFTEMIGYEVFESGSNPNYSRSYGYFIEPTQFTGVLGSYQATEWFGFCAGIANTWLPGLNARPTRAGAPAAESEKTYMGMVTLTAPKSFGFLSGATLNLGVIDGLAGGSSDTTSLYVGGTTPTPLKNLSLGYAWEYRGTKEKNGVAATYAHAASLYLMYQATEKLKFASRTEYAAGTQGTWYAVAPTETQPKNRVFGWTFTADYSLWENVVSRVEFRWDHDLANQKPFGVTDNNALSLALNVIYRF